MSNHELCYLSAHQAISRFTNQSLSPVELMQALIARSEQLEPHINAFTDTYFEAAMDQAKAAETRYRRGTQRALEGIPVAIKDEFKLAGKRRSSASLVYSDRYDDETEIIIQRLLDAGAIPLAKTTTPEFCLLGSCHSRLWGITRNPWNLDITPGGSSGGSGAALAAGTTTIATGTDIGGSIRIPSALCGVVGYKAPYGRNPEIAVFNLDYYSHSGPMARCVSDAAIMQNLISGVDNQDIASLREKVIIDSAIPDTLKGWKIAWSMDLGFMEIDDSVRDNTLVALELLRSLGATVEEVEIDWDESIIDAAHNHWAQSWAASMDSLLETRRDDLCDYTVWFIENARNSTPQDYLKSIETEVRMYNRFGPLMDDYDIFICPTLTTTGIPNDSSWPENEIEVNGQIRQVREEHWSATYPFNMLSRCPVMTMPSGLAANGVPTGIQFVARSYDDQRVFSAALAYERAFANPHFQLDQRITHGDNPC
ncbi:MAG: amidase [Gammaproteobacteria bacterium]|nr:amidase [Gammaproteobacteria bacterium]